MLSIDPKLLLATLILVLLGTIMIYSASSIVSYFKYNDMNFVFKKQVLRVLLSIIALAFGLLINYKRWETYSNYLLIGVGVLLVFTLIPILAGQDAVKGAQRWIQIFGIASIQPSEFAKFALIVFIASKLSLKNFKWTNFNDSVLPLILPIAAILLLIILQPNIGMVVGLSLVVGSIFILGRIPVRYAVIMLMIFTTVMIIVIIALPYAQQRILGFANPTDPYDESYQIRQSLITIGSGGVLGVGLGKSLQKLSFLPEAHTEFIFSMVCSELGLIGASFVLVLIGIIVWRGLRISVRAPDDFGTYLAFGITAEIFYFSAINIAVVTNLIPTTGIPLPFMSFGGSQLFVHMFCIGILMNIAMTMRDPIDYKLKLLKQT